jgi:hypothetical protein
MAEHRLMTLHEKLEIGVRASELRKTGKEKEAMALSKTRPLSPWLAKILKEKVGVDYLRKSGWNMAEAEAAFGCDWLDR